MRRSPYVRQAIISTEGGFIIQDNERHNERRDQEAELSSTMCSDVKGETIPQDISREQLKMGAYKAQSVNLFILASGSCEPQRSAFFDVRDCLQMLNPVGTRTPIANTQEEFSTLNTKHSHLKYLPQSEEWMKNA